MGEVAAGELEVGELVETRDSGLQAIRWIGTRRLGAAALVANLNLGPIRIYKGALGAGLPSTDLLVSPQHRSLVRSQIAQRKFGTDEVLVAAKQRSQSDGIEVAHYRHEVTYVHFLLNAHRIVLANGGETESLFTGAEALKSVGPAARKEIFAIFPKLASGGLCRKLPSPHVQNNKPLVFSPGADSKGKPEVSLIY